MGFRHLKPLISEELIAEKVQKTAAQIKKDFQGEDLVIVMVLKGAICLVADLIRQLDVPLDLETVQCESYGALGKSRGDLTLIGVDRLRVHNRDVLIVDDIFDSGYTMATLVDTVKKLGPRSIKSCVLLYKKDVQKATEYRPDYVMFEIDNLFVVGYGLDYKEKYRGLAGVYTLEDS